MADTFREEKFCLLTYFCSDGLAEGGSDGEEKDNRCGNGSGIVEGPAVDADGDGVLIGLHTGEAYSLCCHLLGSLLSLFEAKLSEGQCIQAIETGRSNARLHRHELNVARRNVAKHIAHTAEGDGFFFLERLFELVDVLGANDACVLPTEVVHLGEGGDEVFARFLFVVFEGDRAEGRQEDALFFHSAAAHLCCREGSELRDVHLALAEEQIFDVC